MAKGNISPAFLRHLSFFASKNSSSSSSSSSSGSTNNKITILSALRSSLSLGLNFPISLLLSLSLRILYSPTIFLYARPDLDLLQPHQSRTMLESVDWNAAENGTDEKSSYSRDEMLSLIPRDQNSYLNRGHVMGLWALAADNVTGRVSRDDLREMQQGKLLERISRRREVGRSRQQVLPFLRGGPGNVAGHSWFVWRLFGVRVYAWDKGKQKS